MSAQSTDNVYLTHYFAPLAAWLDRPDVTDLYINRPGELWLETLSEAPVPIAAPELTRSVLARLVRQIAAVSAQGIDREHPLLAATLPGGERVQAVIPPATRGEIAIAIRKHVAAAMRLDDYRANGATAATAILADGELDRPRSPIAKDRDPIALLGRAVRERRNVLISGGTSSGKTTFANALLREVPLGERLVLIEDTPELQYDHPNAIGLVAARGTMGEAAVSAEDLLIAALRLRPDRIILGEVRGAEAVTFLRAVNTGHPGSITTIHADSPMRAIDQLALLVMQTGTRMAWDDVVTYVRKSIDVIVQLRRDGSGRRVESVLLVD